MLIFMGTLQTHHFAERIQHSMDNASPAGRNSG
ncbi:hypothetical protein M2299_000651 [Stenotrophomonas sp. 1278]|jgi:hypothetical protein|nr:hypothetical protein [Stenotrophomonas sp. 1278]